MECEICGASEAPYLTVIEGAKMQACARCAHMGKIITYPSAPARPKGESAGSFVSSSPARAEFEIIEGFGVAVRNARMKLKLPLSVLAERLNEKESFLERIEHEGTHPSEALAKKLERELGVKLLEQVEASGESASNPKARKEVTLGDILDFQMRKKKEGK